MRHKEIANFLSMSAKTPALALCIGFAAAIVSGCGAERCDAVAIGRRLAGEGAVDCGLALTVAESAAVTRCAVDAKQEGKPYTAAYEMTGRDSTITIVVAESATGRWYVKSDDFSTSVNGVPRVDQRRCASIGSSTGADGRTLLSCELPSVAEELCR